MLSGKVSDSAYLRFQSLAAYRQINAGETVPNMDIADRFVFLASGATKLVAEASGGREQVVAFHFADDLVSIPARGPHGYTLRALTDCDILVLPSLEFMQIAHTEPVTLGEVARRALDALWRCREKAVLLGRKTAQERIASFLIATARRIGSIERGACVLSLPMSRRDIADSLGLTTETVSRQFTDLRLMGLIATSGRSEVRLLDIAGLEARAGNFFIAA